ncbi:MAG: ATP-binding protein [Pseudomonadales bacterium]
MSGPTSLFGRLAWGIVIGFLVLHVGTMVFHGHERMVSEAEVFAANTAERALTIAGAARHHPELLEALSTPYFRIRYQPVPEPEPARIWPHSREIRGALDDRLDLLGFPGTRDARVWFTSDRRTPRLHLELPAVEGAPERWLVVDAVGPEIRGRTLATVWTTTLLLVVLLIVLWVTRRFTRSLPHLALAAEQLGRSQTPAPLPEKGPREVRRLVRAFNAMQDRVTGLLAERNTMLGALSHDVRTLVTRLGLRLENLSESEIQRQASQDIEAVITLLDEALAFARNEAGGEKRSAVDLSSLLQTLVDDRADRGEPVTFDGPELLVIEGEAVGLRRTFGNLVDNALRYGGSARVSLRHEGATAVVDVADPGPGIPEADEQRALQPFERLERSRNRHTGGSGLGLSVASRIVERHGGRLEFLRGTSEFVVRVVLPERGAGQIAAQAGHQK